MMATMQHHIILKNFQHAVVMIYVLHHCNHMVFMKHIMVSEVVDLKQSLNYKSLAFKMSAFKPPSMLSLNGNVADNWCKWKH